MCWGEGACERKCEWRCVELCGEVRRGEGKCVEMWGR